MHTAFLYNLGLFLHMIGLFLLAGGDLGAIVVERLLWQRVQNRDVSPAVALLPLLRQFPMVILGGVLLMPLSGLLMMQQVNWSYWGQFWLMGKIVLYVLMVLNGALVANPLGQRLEKTLQPQPVAKAVAGIKNDAFGLPDELPRLRRQLHLFNVSQMLMLLILFLLATFKPV